MHQAVSLETGNDLRHRRQSYELHVSQLTDPHRARVHEGCQYGSLARRQLQVRCCASDQSIELEHQGAQLGREHIPRIP